MILAGSHTVPTRVVVNPSLLCALMERRVMSNYMPTRLKSKWLDAAQLHQCAQPAIENQH